jgi:hypothetical protein
MQPESSLPYSQVPAICPYPEPTPSSPHNTLPLPEDPDEAEYNMGIISKHIHCEGMDYTGMNKAVDRWRAPVETTTNF